MATKFQFEPDVALKDKPRTERTKKEYTAKLNSLAKLGWADRATLKANYEPVKAHIEGLYDDDENGRLKKRFIVYAIFWSMDADYLKEKNDYWKYLQTINPLKVIGTNEDWKPKAEYLAQ